MKEYTEPTGFKIGNTRAEIFLFWWELGEVLEMQNIKVYFGKERGGGEYVVVWSLKLKTYTFI